MVSWELPEGQQCYNLHKVKESNEIIPLDSKIKRPLAILASTVLTNWRGQRTFNRAKISSKSEKVNEVKFLSRKVVVKGRINAVQVNVSRTLGMFFLKKED